ncbi:MAG: hypothetical protein NUV86_01465 [Candidatus Scalindua sp.]|nr:hypothetical protein [Candidatus Scalindua sp.]MCR4343935.1 hypothetical protein [Candidatus Scalindua sp.]
MRYPRILCILSIFAFMGIGVTGINHVGAEEWVASFEAFKSTDDPAYHQRHNGNIDWELFHDAPAAETKTDKPKNTDIYWIESDAEWYQRNMDAEGASALRHFTPANVADSKYHSPCPLCGDLTYFWLKTGDMDSDTEKHIKGDYPGWKKADGVCLNCFGCYQLRAGKFFEGNAASTTDKYVIGYMKSPQIQDYFTNVK